MDKPRTFAPIIAAVLLLLPVLYVGSYFALVVPTGVPRPFYLGVDPNTTRLISVRTDKRYRTGGAFPERFFWPLEQIDRRVRPEAWETEWDEFEPISEIRVVRRKP